MLKPFEETKKCCAEPKMLLMRSREKARREVSLIL